MGQGMGFQTRSVERDRDGDLVRINGVREAVIAARASAQSEQDGLRKRVLEARARAVALMDSSGDYGERAAEDESDIAAAARAATAAEQRVVDLDASIRLFDELMERLDSAIQPRV